MRRKVMETNGNVHLLKIRTSIDIFKNEKCKVTFGLEYIKNMLYCWFGTQHLINKINVVRIHFNILTLKKLQIDS